MLCFKKNFCLYILFFFTSLVFISCDTVHTKNENNKTNNLDCQIPTNKLIDSGVGRGGIPALTNPPLVHHRSENTDYLADSSRVIGLLFGERALAIPHNILWHHEIVNIDNWGGSTISVTYCPLTGSSIAFSRSAINKAELGVSGLLFNNNLVMYDRRKNESLWPQMNRKAGCGPAIGNSLKMLPVIEMRWEHWRTLHPETKIVSSHTGYARNYRPDGYPYGNYEQLRNERLLFKGTPVDNRRPPKERVLGIPVGGAGGIALPFGALRNASPVRVVKVPVAGRKVTVFWNREARSAMAFNTTNSFSVVDGNIVDDATGSVWTVEGRAVDGPREGEQLKPINKAYVAFWFAWAAFQPATALWTSSS
ncbi:MAG: DUF3179 domain-containing protein [Salinibacter sp.]